METRTGFTLRVGTLEENLAALDAVIADEAIVDERLTALEAEQITAHATKRRLGWHKGVLVAASVGKGPNRMTQQAFSNRMVSLHAGRGWSRQNVGHNLRAWRLASEKYGLAESVDLEEGVEVTIYDDQGEFGTLVAAAAQMDPKSIKEREDRKQDRNSRLIAGSRAATQDTVAEQQAEREAERERFVEEDLPGVIERAIEAGVEIEYEDDDPDMPMRGRSYRDDGLVAMPAADGKRLVMMEAWVTWDAALLSHNVGVMLHLSADGLDPKQREAVAKRLTGLIERLTAVRERVLDVTQPAV